MSEVADKVLTDEKAKAMGHLAERALMGDSNSFNRWIGISREFPEDEQPQANRNEFSQALAWRTEPEWQGELSEAESETAVGSREPEGEANSL